MYVFCVVGVQPLHGAGDGHGGQRGGLGGGPEARRGRGTTRQSARYAHRRHVRHSALAGQNPFKLQPPFFFEITLLSEKKHYY